MFTFKPNTAEQKDVENTKLADHNTPTLQTDRRTDGRISCSIGLT